MCVIASIPAGSTIDEKTLRNMWNRNPDGAGIAWLEDGRVNMYKSMKLKPFLTKFKVVVKSYGSSDILVHMRIATCGEVCLDNNHPFYLLQNGQELKDTVFAHNGQLFDYTPPAKFSHLSDTRYFNELFFNNFNILSLDDWRVQEMIGNIIGKHSNKFVVLSANPALKAETYIINKHLGEYVGKVWYSNLHHEPVKSTWKGTTYTRSQPTLWDGRNDDTMYETQEDDKVLEMIRQSDPDACIIPANGDDIDKYSSESGLYDSQLQYHPEFKARVDGALAYTGMNTLEEVAEYYFFEIDHDGNFVCPDCQARFSETFDRNCAKGCPLSDYDPVEYDQMHLIEMEDKALEDKLLAQKFESQADSDN